MDFHNGARKTSDPRKANTGLMTRFAQMVTEEEIKVAAQYFTAIPAIPWITVVESKPNLKTGCRPILRLWKRQPGNLEQSESSHSRRLRRHPWRLRYAA
jgi:hypothetical protein